MRLSRLNQPSAAKHALRSLLNVKCRYAGSLLLHRAHE